MKRVTLISLWLMCIPFWVMAQSSNDDLYFIPKKKVEKKTTAEKKTTRIIVEDEEKSTAVYATPGTTVVVKDVKGNTRDVDEYNRRYTSRENTFTMENDTLYIEEKPYNEQGEWVNGFEGSQDDYEYAMRIVRFRNPRYAIPVSSPLYWEVVYALPSWDWNVYDDGHYAYVFPSYTNRLWWDWRFDYSWRWHRPWYYGSWHSPYWYGNYWYGNYWRGSYWGYHHHWHHHHMPHFAWGGYWGKPHGWYGSSAHRPGIHAGRYNSTLHGSSGIAGNVSRRYATTQRNSRDNYLGTKQSTRNSSNVRSSSGRVVTAKDGSSSVRPQRSAVRTRTGESTVNRSASDSRARSSYTRPVQGKSSSYNRPSSTRSSVTKTSPSYQRKSSSTSRSNVRSSTARRSNENASYRSSSSRSSSRSSFSSGGSSSRSSMGGGASRSSGGSRGGGGRR